MLPQPLAPAGSGGLQEPVGHFPRASQAGVEGAVQDEVAGGLPGAVGIITHALLLVKGEPPQVPPEGQSAKDKASGDVVPGTCSPDFPEVREGRVEELDLRGGGDILSPSGRPLREEPLGGKPLDLTSGAGKIHKVCAHRGLIGQAVSPLITWDTNMRRDLNSHQPWGPTLSHLSKQSRALVGMPQSLKARVGVRINSGG